MVTTKKRAIKYAQKEMIRFKCLIIKNHNTEDSNAGNKDHITSIKHIENKKITEVHRYQ